MMGDGRMQQILNEIGAITVAINDGLGAALSVCGKVRLDLTEATSSSGVDAQSLVSRIAALTAGSESIGKLEPNKLALAPTSRLQGLLNNLSALNQGIAAFTALLNTVGDVQGYDASSGVLSGSENNANVREHLDILQAASDKALEAYLIVAAAARPRGIGTFAAASNALAQSATEASELLESLKGEANALRKKAEQLESQAGSVAQTQGEAQRLTDEIEKARRTADENEQKILASSVAAEDARSKAASVEAQMQAYEDKFTAFQQTLETREEAIRTGQARLAGLEKGLTEKDGKADELIAKATKMLGGATIAGLSSTYHTKANDVDKQLKLARYGFYGAMAFLFFSVLIALNLTNLGGLLTGVVTPLPAQQFGMTASEIAVRTLASLGSRALVVLPSLLLAGFAAHRHSALFRLREEYSHKEAMAVSVQGFKEQAPTYQEPIAAAVFQELLANPATSMDKPAPRRKPNGFVQRLIAPAVEDAFKKLLELRDGAISA